MPSPRVVSVSLAARGALVLSSCTDEKFMDFVPYARTPPGLSDQYRRSRDNYSPSERLSSTSKPERVDYDVMEMFLWGNEPCWYKMTVKIAFIDHIPFRFGPSELECLGVTPFPILQPHYSLVSVMAKGAHVRSWGHEHGPLCNYHPSFTALDANEIEIYERRVRHYPHKNVRAYFGILPYEGFAIGTVLEGEDFSPYSLQDVAEWCMPFDALQVCRGVVCGTLHLLAIGVYHSTLKMSNIKLRKNGDAVIDDLRFASMVPFEAGKKDVTALFHLSCFLQHLAGCNRDNFFRTVWAMLQIVIYLHWLFRKYASQREQEQATLASGAAVLHRGVHRNWKFDNHAHRWQARAGRVTGKRKFCVVKTPASDVNGLSPKLGG
ncbi:hypothetical protein K488DRAFT_71367 [Vararia minispora EC-137]|uniref:Uncharacterized protein n=1 Tax=Vararia minispora EC-137 TaxID=1314806 RepID=A0ACB8QI54_9AGAM|nr:hypothetical protein K488DRAFT_71367 [Vararia minispora EC-137]